MATTSARPTGRNGTSLPKRILVGRAVSSSRLEHTLLPKVLALPVFSSDALSSVAYATEEILHVLLTYTIAAYAFVMPIAIAIGSLMTIVVLSYRQTVKAYPNGGGAYIVSKENLGTIPGLIAAAALLTDYVLTVSVSVVAGVFAMTSAAPGLLPIKVEISLGFVILITLANLRGVRESGTLFAFPTYAFIVSILIMISTGLVRCVGGCPHPTPVPPSADLTSAVGAVGLFAILRAFSSGSTALTGVEAISNGVPAFRRPQAKNAAETLAIMGAVSVTMFLGISFLASRMHPTVSDQRSVVGQIAEATFGKGIAFYLVQIFTAAILVLAANTSFQDFPRLSSILARDRFMPRQFANRGDRLVFSNGVIVLAAFASLLIVIFDADLTRLIQLYVVGVFTSFTLSQTGMVRHWLKEKRKGEAAAKGWRRSMIINGIGAATTGLVLVVVAYTKFKHGAWIVIAAMPFIVLLFRSIHDHYVSVMEQLREGVLRPGPSGVNSVVLLVRALDGATAEALGYLRSFRPPELRVVFLASGAVPVDLAERWREMTGGGVPDIEPLACPGGDLLGAARGYLAGIDRAPEDFVTVIVPETVRGGLFGYLLGNRQLVRLKAGLLREPNVVVCDVPLLQPEGAERGVDRRSLIPQRTVVLVFVSAVHDPTVRAVSYARTLGATETRAVYFDLDPDQVHSMEEAWFDKGLGIPLDIVETPFRDLTRPMLEEVRRFTSRPDTLVSVVIPELLVTKWRHLLLHNQNALFVKRLLLFEERTVLTSVPYLLRDRKAHVAAQDSA
ncbi:MAG: APC family permease [Actinobacteria bacterium]|nr:APC family permease [Actinomycetota bacterium]